MLKRIKAVVAKAGVGVAQATVSVAQAGVGVVVVGSVPMMAHAAGGPDYTALTSGVDFTSTIAAVLAVAALLVSLFLAVRGAKIVIGMVRGS
jgi:hypothetical protein